MAKVELVLEGKKGAISVSTIGKALLATDKLLHTLDPEAGDLPVSSLSLGSIHAELSVSDNAENLLHSGLLHLVEEPSMPCAWDSETVSALAELYEVTERGGVTATSFVTARGTQVVDMNIYQNSKEAKKTALNDEELVLTSLSGVICSYSNYIDRPRTVRICRDGEEKGTELRVPDHLADATKDLLDERAEIWGLARRSKSTGKIIRIDIEGIESAIARSKVQVPARELRGIWDSGDGKSDSVAEVRKMRDAW